MSNRISAVDLARKFADPRVTLSGEPRARVGLTALQTLWFNTGTLCNIACANCYIESSPENDRLSYLTLAEVEGFLQEVSERNLGTKEIGITGGEPFMNPDILPIMEVCLQRGFQLLVLTNAMKPMMRPRIQTGLLALHARFSQQLTLRVSIDHFAADKHEQERGPGSWAPMIDGLKWLQDNDFNFHIAGRTQWGESEAALRRGYRETLERLGIGLEAQDPNALVLFPEIDPTAEVPEITESCWGILGVNPADMMCASSRMVVKVKGADAPSVMACTLLAYEDAFNLGRTLAEAEQAISLNHPSCAKFCVLGGGSCSG